MTLYNWNSLEDMVPPARVWLDGKELTRVIWADTNCCHVQRYVTNDSGKIIKNGDDWFVETLVGITMRIEFDDGKVVTTDNWLLHHSPHDEDGPSPKVFQNKNMAWGDSDSAEYTSYTTQPTPLESLVLLAERTGRRIILD